MIPASAHGNGARPHFADMSATHRNRSLDNMAAQIAELTAANNALNARVSAHAGSLNSHDGRILDALVKHDTFVARSFLSRLRWLFTGR